jgi:hypothetical protein
MPLNSFLNKGIACNTLFCTKIMLLTLMKNHLYLSLSRHNRISEVVVICSLGVLLYI